MPDQKLKGAKAKNLRILQRLGLRVPEFYEISAETLAELADQKVADKLVAEFFDWCIETGCDAVAVRSSAEDEDNLGQSFAGQYASVMNVKGGNKFLSALRTVAGSRPSSAYSSGKASKVHAVVQRYIEPDVAGVLFTVNPASGRAEMLINAAPGHGSKVVEGIEASAICIDRVSGDIRSAEKQVLLSSDDIRSLQKLGAMVESHMRCPQDIEWAYQAGALYALQARPITRIAHLQVWDNANIAESFPGIVLPLTFSISRRGYELVYKSQGYAAGLNWYQLEGNHRTFQSMVGLFGGRMYYNLANWYRFIGLFPNNAQNQKYLDEQLQTIGDAAYLPPSHYPLTYKLRFFSRVLRRALFFDREKRHYWRYLEQSYQTYETLPSSQDLFLLMGRYGYIEQQVIPHMGRSADNDFFVMIYHGILKGRLRRWLGEGGRHETDFLGSLHDVISARQATLLSEIAAEIKRDPRADNLLHTGDYQALDAYLETTPAGGLISEYRMKFLHRFAEDQKIEARNPLLPLSGFYSLIKTYQQLDSADLAKRRKSALEADAQRNNRIMRQLRAGRRVAYKLLLRRLKHHLRIREHNRLLRGKAYAYLRELFILVGESLQAQGIIADAEDVHYLDIEEIFRLTDGTGYSDDIRHIISERRKRYTAYGRLEPPARFITTGLADDLPADFLSSPAVPAKTLKTLPGTISSPGNVEGKVVVLDRPVIPEEPFDILVVSHTDPGWTPLIALAKGLVVEHGGILSHAAIVTRELGIPSIIGVENATRQLKTGMRVRIDSAQGAVKIL